MNRPPDERYEFRARIGVGASFGAIIGAILAALLFLTTQAVLIGVIIGAGLGAVVGSRLKSQAFQFLWIEYSREVARRAIIAGILFLAPFSLLIYFLKVGTSTVIKILLISLTSFAGLFLIYTFGTVITQLDDLLKKVLLEAFAIGIGISLFIFLSLGLLSLAFPIAAHWLVAFLIILASMLIGRITVAVKYR